MLFGYFKNNLSLCIWKIVAHILLFRLSNIKKPSKRNWIKRTHQNSQQEIPNQSESVKINLSKMALWSNYLEKKKTIWGVFD
jgi:hypothetical protein